MSKRIRGKYMNGLLVDILEKLDSLEQLFQIEYSTIARKSKKITSENRFAWLVETYLHEVAFGKLKIEHNASINALFEKLSDIIDVKEIIDDENSTDRKRIVFRIKENKYASNASEIDVFKGAAEYRKFRNMPTMLVNNTLIMLIVLFEEFIAKYISQLYTLYPEKYLNNQNICFSEILHTDINEIRENIVQREVESIMRQSYSEWFKLFESHKINFSQIKAEIEILKEIYARRNILVHNSGRVNSIYLRNVPTSTYNIGDILNANMQYLETAFSNIKKIIFALVIESNKFLKNNTYLLSEAFDCAFSEMLKEHYDVSSKAFELMKSVKNSSGQDKLLAQFNYWISLKELKGLDSIRDEITQFDTSALNQSFILAKFLLLEENDSATALLEDMLEKDEISANEVMNWPLFIEYRKTADYQAIQQKYSDKFKLSSIEAAPDTDLEQISISTELKEIES